MKIVVYTQAWANDRAAQPGEKPTALLHGIVELDGVLLPYATGVTVEAKGTDFMEASVHVIPTSVEFVALNNDQWVEKMKENEAAT